MLVKCFFVLQRSEKFNASVLNPMIQAYMKMKKTGSEAATIVFVNHGIAAVM